MRNDQVLSIKEIKLEDLEQVAHLHIKAFTDSTLSKMGHEPTRRYYEWQLVGPHDCYAIGVFGQENTLLGFCFSGIFRGSLTGFLQKNRGFLIRWILTHPWLAMNELIIDQIKMARNLFTKKPQVKMGKPSFGVLSIAVDPERQG